MWLQQKRPEMLLSNFTYLMHETGGLFLFPSRPVLQNWPIFENERVGRRQEAAQQRSHANNMQDAG